MTEKAQWSIASPAGDHVFIHVSPREMVHIPATAPWQLALYISLSVAFGDLSSELAVSHSETVTADQGIFASENLLGPQQFSCLGMQPGTQVAW